MSTDISDLENCLGQMAPIKIKDMTEGHTFASYLDLPQLIVRGSQLHTSICERCDDLLMKIFSFLSSNVQYSPACGVFSLVRDLYYTPEVAFLFNA